MASQFSMRQLMQQKHSTLAHPGPLTWPEQQVGELPLLGQHQLVKREELEERGIVATFFQSRTFELSDAEHKAVFDLIYDQVCQGLAYIKKRTDRWADDKSAPTVFLEWVQLYNDLSGHGLGHQE